MGSRAAAGHDFDVALARRLSAARTIDEAASAVVEHLVEAGMPLPSLYLERGGRLRCRAMRGYWQVQDGIPPSRGVIGATVRGGETMLIRPQHSNDYIEAAPNVASEVCVPLWDAGTVIGAVNVEAEFDLGDEHVRTVEASAAAFATRLAELGGRPRESLSQQLVRHVTELACLTDAGEVSEYTLAAACEMAGMESAFLVLFDAKGTPAVTARTGRLSGMLCSIGTAGLVTIASWVETGSSCYTMGDPSGVGFAGQDAFRQAGAHTVVVLPLSAGGRQLGVLVVADPSSVPPHTEQLERLELLAVQAAGCLLTAEAMTELRERAERDPLTGLGHHATFNAALAGARRRTSDRRRHAVLVLDVDGFKSINDTHGHQVGDQVLVEVAAALSGAVREGDAMYRIGGDEFAAVLGVTGEADALAAAERLREAVAATGWTTASIGVAVAASAEDDSTLLARADRALYEVKASGRDACRLGATE
ncbi:MAG: diguanylate cyclase [Actinomycetota bacterium]|nr:diguanylate cyclase [Actinomycetota bacterium]